MPVTFQGGYVGGPATQPLDLSPIGQGIQARNQRLDAPQAARLEQYDLPGLAYMAANGDDNAKRFLDRYYGRDQWQQYVPTLEGNTFIPPAGVPWDVNARARLEIDTFGFAPSMGESAPAGKEAGQQKTGEQVKPEQQTQPEVVQTDTTPPIVESQAQTTTPPVTDNTVVTNTTTETPRQQWQRPWKQQEIVESTPPPQQPPAQTGPYYSNEASRTTGQRTAVDPLANPQFQALVGSLYRKANDMLARGIDPWKAWNETAARGGADPEYAAALQMLGGLTSNTGQSAYTDPRAAQAALASEMQRFASMLPPQERRGVPPVAPPTQANAPNPLDTPTPGAGRQMPANPESTPLLPFPGATPGLDAVRQRQQSALPQQPYSARVAQSTEGAGYQSAMQPMEPTASTQTPYRDQATGEPVAANPLLDTINRVTGEARSNAAAHARSVESQIADEQVQIINEATGRGNQTTPTLYLGKRAEGIPLHSAAERSTAQHIVKLATTEPGSRSNKAAAAAIRNVFKQGAPELRRAIRENVQQNGYLVPQGEFARQVYDAVRADPQGTAVFFNDLATNYLNAGLTQAQTSYQQALAREQNASAAQQEIQTASLERLGPDYADAIQRENLRSLRLANQMTEVQLAFAPQQYSTQIIEALTAAGVSRINAEVAADTIGLARSQLEMQAQIAWLDQQGKLAEVLSGDNLERAKVIVETLKNGEIVEGTPADVLAAMRNEMYAGLAGVTYDGKDIRYLFGIPWLRFGGQGEVTDVPGFPSYADMWRTGQDQGNTGGTNTTTEPTPEETNVGSDYNLQ